MSPRQKNAIFKPQARGQALEQRLLGDLREMIAGTRETLARQINSAQAMLYWQIGKKIRGKILGGKRANYGRAIVSDLARQLSLDFGSGFSEKNLWRMIQFNQTFPNEEIVVTLSRQLGWSHFVALLPLVDPLKREFYAEMCRVERWSVRTLRQKIEGMLYERTALSRKPKELIRRELTALKENDRLTPDLVFRDPYILDFLGLADTFSEKDLESAILREMESFILELGSGFSFVARQKRMTIDGADYFLDLLFYHRMLRRLVAIELKLGSFKAEYMGQMELYLRWLAKHEARQGERTPMGLILCAGKSEEHIELLELDEGRLRVATYITELPPKDVLARKLHASIETARQTSHLGKQHQKR